MFRFSHSEYLYLLCLIPILILFFVGWNLRRKKQLADFGSAELLKQLMPDASNARLYVKFWLLIAALSLWIFVIAGPQFGSKLEVVKKQGVELMIALDVSNSMLAEDLTPSRMEKAKQMLSKLIDALRNDKVGLLVFAGDAFTQMPITNDVTSAKIFLSSINPGMVSVQGTAIGAAIDLGVRSFGPETEAGRAVVVITDGENHEDDPVAAAAHAFEKGIKVHVVGIGSPQGTPIPSSAGGNSFIKDKSGNVVISKLDETTCKKIAEAGGGVYVRADNSNAALRVLKNELDKMAKAEVESKVYSEYNEQFQVIAWFVLALLIAEFFVLERRNRLLKHVQIFAVDDKKGEKA